MNVNPENKTYKQLSEAEKASLRAMDLTQQLLIFSRGGIPIKEATSIEEILKETANFSLRGSNVRCDIFIPDDLWLVESEVIFYDLSSFPNEARPKKRYLNQINLFGNFLGTFFV
jgi:hypothetical protein